MKPAAFDYHAPSTLEEAIDLLARHGGEAKVLAGGQSLVPAMNFRLATPSALVDINRIPGHDRIRREDGRLVIGMLVRHRALELLPPTDPLSRLLSATARFVGHLPIRVRGTFCGSIAHADPAAEWCALLVGLGGAVTARGPQGARSVPATELFEGPFETALSHDEVLVEAQLPLLDGCGVGFVERARTAGDFATVAVAAAVGLEDGAVVRCHLGAAGVEGRPVRLGEAESVLAGRVPDERALSEAAAAAADSVEPTSDAHCSAGYRRHLLAVLCRRALTAAVEDAP